MKTIEIRPYDTDYVVVHGREIVHVSFDIVDISEPSRLLDALTEGPA